MAEAYSDQGKRGTMDVRELKDRQLVNYWNDGDGSLSWLLAIEEELTRRGYTPRETGPDDQRPRIGGERVRLEVRS